MSYQKTDCRIAIALNAKIETGRLMNAYGHTLTGLAGMLSGDALQLTDYPAPALSAVAKISHFPVIVLKSKNSAGLKRLLLEAHTAGLDANFFTSSMIQATEAEQIEATRNDPDPELMAAAVFGASANVAAITKRLSLYS